MVNFYFDSKLPSDRNKVPIAFLGATSQDPSRRVSLLQALRYVPENYSHLGEISWRPGNLDVAQAQIKLNFAGTTLNSTLGSPVGAFNTAYSSAKVEEASIVLEFPQDPLSILGLHKDPTGGYKPIIRGGRVWRYYRVSENEPSHSWLIRSGLVEGDEVFLCYTVPETSLNTQVALTATGSPYYEGGVTYQSRVHTTTPTTPNTVVLPSVPIVITRITINGSDLFNEQLVPGDSNTHVRSLDNTTGIITMVRSLSPNDKVEVEYLVPSDTYIYSGYRGMSSDNNWYWHHCDLNPDYGNMVFDPTTRQHIPSSVALYNQVLIYAIPTAYIKFEIDSQVDNGSGDYIFQITGTFTSAYDYDETHFIRHYVGTNTEEFDADYGILPTNFLNYWGIAPLGLSEYDETGQVGIINDVYSNVLPSMMPLGKFLLGTETLQGTAFLADVRQRGGGIEYPVSPGSVNQVTDADTRLQGLWDAGTWNGKSISDGGTVEVTLPESVLQTYTSKQVEELVKQFIPPGIEVKIQYDNS